MKLNKTLIALTAVFFILSAMKLISQTLLNENSVKFENVQTATLVGQDGLIMRTVDGGLNWIPQTSGITNVLNSIDYVSYFDSLGAPANMLITVGENGIILKSIDNGITWINITSGLTENLNDIAIFSPNMIFVCGNNGTLLRSVDFGETWSTAGNFTSNNLNDIVICGPNASLMDVNAVVVGDSGTVIGSINLEDWFTIVVPTTENLTSSSFMAKYIVCAGTNGTILKSENNGIDWVVSTSGISSIIYDIKFVNHSTIVAASENGVMVRSEDTGENWTVVTTPVSVDLFAVNFGNELFGISTGAEGTEIYTTDAGLTWVSSISTETAKNTEKEQVSLFQNYPNPFNPSTVISYSVNVNSSVNLRVYDMTGREVRTLVNSFMNAGTYSVNFNADNLASGIYFYVLRVNNGLNEITKTNRMILTK